MTFISMGNSWNYGQFSEYEGDWKFQSPNANPSFKPETWWGFEFDFSKIVFAKNTVDLMCYVVSNHNLQMSGDIYINDQLFRSNVKFADQGKNPDSSRRDHFPLIITGIPVTSGKVKIQFLIKNATNVDYGTFVYGFKTVGKVSVKP